MKRDLIKIFRDEIYSNSPKKNYKTNKIVYNPIDEKWSLDLIDMIDYKVLKNKIYRYKFIIVDNFSKYTWAIPSKNVKTVKQTVTKAFPNIQSTSKRKPFKLESDRGKECCNSIFQYFSKNKINQHYSRYTE